MQTKIAQIAHKCYQFENTILDAVQEYNQAIGVPIKQGSASCTPHMPKGLLNRIEQCLDFFIYTQQYDDVLSIEQDSSCSSSIRYKCSAMFFDIAQVKNNLLACSVPKKLIYEMTIDKITMINHVDVHGEVLCHVVVELISYDKLMQMLELLQYSTQDTYADINDIKDPEQWGQYIERLDDVMHVEIVRYLNRTKRHIKKQEYDKIKDRPIFYIRELKADAKPLKKYIDGLARKHVNVFLVRVGLTYDIERKIHETQTDGCNMLGIYACADVELEDFLFDGKLDINVPALMVRNIIRYGSEQVKKQRDALIITAQQLESLQNIFQSLETIAYCDKVSAIMKDLCHYGQFSDFISTYCGMTQSDLRHHRRKNNIHEDYSQESHDTKSEFSSSPAEFNHDC